MQNNRVSQSQDSWKVGENIAVSGESLGMSGHGSAPLHEYRVYAVNPMFGLAPPVLGAPSSAAPYACRASLTLPGACSQGASAGDAARAQASASIRSMAQ